MLPPLSLLHFACKVHAEPPHSDQGLAISRVFVEICAQLARELKQCDLPLWWLTGECFGAAERCSLIADVIAERCSWSLIALAKGFP